MINSPPLFNSISNQSKLWFNTEQVTVQGLVILGCKNVQSNNDLFSREPIVLYKNSYKKTSKEEETKVWNQKK